MAMMRSSQMQRQPQGKDAFQLSDTDGNGLVSSTELETLASGIAKVTGSTINVDEALSSYDADQDGGLSGEELLQMLTGMGFSPPEMAAGEDGRIIGNATTTPTTVIRTGHFRLFAKQRR